MCVLFYSDRVAVETHCQDRQSRSRVEMLNWISHPSALAHIHEGEERMSVPHGRRLSSKKISEAFSCEACGFTLLPFLSAADVNGSIKSSTLN